MRYFLGCLDEDIICLFLVTHVVGIGDTVVSVEKFHLTNVRLQRRYQRRNVFVRNIDVAYILD